MEKCYQLNKPPIRVLVTGAAGQIAYSILHPIAKGDVFGHDQPVILHLLDIPVVMGVLNGVEMEIRDCAFPLVSDLVSTADVATAFKDIDAAFLIGAMPRREGMERSDLLKANVSIFKDQGKALDTYANKNVKVLVVGNPANTNAYICGKYAPSIPKENITAMTRLDQNRTTGHLAAMMSVNPDNISNVIVWGNHSSTQYPDVSHAMVFKDGQSQKVVDIINDTAYLKGEFINIVRNRGAAVIAARKLSSAMSAAKAACDHMRDWFQGTPAGQYVSMAVYSTGAYGMPPDIIYSFPVKIDANGVWSIVEGLDIDEFSLSKMTTSAEELIKERDDALAVCSN